MYEVLKCVYYAFMCLNLYYFTQLFFTRRTNKQLAQHIQYINVILWQYIVEYKHKVGVAVINLRAV